MFGANNLKTLIIIDEEKSNTNIGNRYKLGITTHKSENL